MDAIKSRRLELPPVVSEAIQSGLFKEFGRTPTAVELAAAALKLSDFYIQNPKATTPWNESWAVTGYLCYFLPLNFLRVQAVIVEAQRLGFLDDLNHFMDFGSGPGTVALALKLMTGSQFATGKNIERAERARQLAKQLFDQLRFSGIEQMAELKTEDGVRVRGAGRSQLSSFSYSLTEIANLPSWALASEALLILEPSTRDDGRKLLELRKNLIAQGFSIWAPCLHQLDCPLLAQSKTDWCHDRIVPLLPSWFLEMEKLLPLKNRTITFSYLLARKTPAAHFVESKLRYRVVGDLQEERGKSKQMVCRRELREFFSWLHRDGTPPEIPRGVAVELGSPPVEKGNELRVAELPKILSD